MWKVWATLVDQECEKLAWNWKSPSKMLFFRRCGQNDGSFRQYAFCKYDIFFKILPRDVFSPKSNHIFISWKFMKKYFFENLAFFISKARMVTFHKKSSLTDARVCFVNFGKVYCIFGKRGFLWSMLIRFAHNFLFEILIFYN